MSEITKIAWATSTLSPKMFSTLQFSNISDAIRLKMLKFMAAVAEGNPVFEIKPERGMRRKWLDVVGAKIPAAFIPTLFAGVIVTRENSLSPSRVFGVSPIIKQSLFCAIFPGIMFWATDGPFHNDTGDFVSCCLGHGAAFPRCRFTLSRFRHTAFCLFSMLMSLKGGRSAFPANSYFHPPASKARGVKAISPTAVFPKLVYRLSRFTSCASFLTGRNTVQKFFESHPDQFRCGLSSPIFSLCHNT